MRFDDNGDDAPNYFPNRFDGNSRDESRMGHPYESDICEVAYFGRNEGDNDHYTQSGMLFDQVMTEEEQQNTIKNTIGAMSGITGPKRDETVNRQLCYGFRAGEKPGRAIAEGLNVSVDTFMVTSHPQQ